MARFFAVNHKQFILEKHLTTQNIKEDVQPQAGNNPLSNNPAGPADIEKGKTPANITEKPDIVTPEIEKSDTDEVPDSKMEEMPYTEVQEIPGK